MDECFIHVLTRNAAKMVSSRGVHLQALEIFKGAFGDDHDLVAREIDALAMLYQRQGKHELAEPMHQRALDIRKKNKPNRSSKVRTLKLLMTHSITCFLVKCVSY